MRWKPIAGLVLMAAANLAGVGLANADDFNITVPIRLNSWPREVAHGDVWCWVGPADMPLIHIGGFGPEASGKVIGKGKTVFPINGDTGAFSDNIVVRFNADQGKNPGDATKYWCVLRLEYSTGFAMIGEGPNAKPGAPLNTSVSGNLTQVLSPPKR
ncbi:MAG TPA: hypothetical protein VKT17_01275 [Acidobacteriota bacterium]|nr:hypothetical protein [Acidobacteriota bacterium]